MRLRIPIFYSLDLLKKTLLIIVVLFTVGLQIVWAQGPPITMAAPGTLGFQGSAFRTFGIYSNSDNGGSYTQVVAIPYNITTNLQVGFIGRYTFVNPNGMSAFSGLNNSTIFFKNQFIVINKKGKTTRISGLVRQTFPTAANKISPEIYSTYIGLAAGDISLSRGLYTNLGYIIRTNGAPDLFQYDASLGVPIFPQVYPLNQLNLFMEVNGITALGNNDHNIFLSPGIQWIKGNILFESAIMLPLIKNSGINQNNFRIQLGTRILI